MQALSKSSFIGRAIGGTVLLSSAVALAGSQGASTKPGHFTLVPKGAVQQRFGYYPVQIVLSTTKPAGIKKEPVYAGSPKYGVIHLGNGPKSDFIVVLDEPAQGDWKIYIDKNQNGDLTDDGDGAWNQKKESSGRTMYGVLDVDLRASYGSKSRESSSLPYTLGFYRFSNLAPLLMYRQSDLEGSLLVDGKAHKAVIVENDGDAIFDKPAKDAEDAKKHRPVWLKVDLNDDGKFSSGIIDARAPFEMGGKVYELKFRNGGTNIDLRPTKKAAVALAPKQMPAPELLKTGVAAPEFTAEKWGGGDLKLSDYRGKVVVLDFWATWCGPCQKSMPHVESVKKKLAGQDVAVLGVCVWDEKKAYEDWIPKNQSKYTFQFAFDPAGSKTADSIAAKLFHVSGIPTTYIIDKDGKVADAIVGYDEGDTRLEKALQKLGVNVAN